MSLIKSKKIKTFTAAGIEFPYKNHLDLSQKVILEAKQLKKIIYSLQDKREMLLKSYVKITQQRDRRWCEKHLFKSHAQGE